jgi:integrase
MASIKLTQTFLSSVERPKSGTLRIMDAEMRGFCADIGTRSIRFYLRRQVHGSTKPIKIGEFPAMTVTQARAVAARLIAQISSGSAPDDSVSNARRVPKLADAIDAYVHTRTTTGKKIKPITVKDLRQRLGLLSDWADKRITEITRQDVATSHAELTVSAGAVTANRVMRYLSAVLNWASDHYAQSDDQPLLARNPVQVLTARKQWNTEKRRQSFISADRLPELWAAICSIPEKAERWEEQAECGRDYFMFVLFTGMRPGEAIRLQVELVNLNRQVFELKDSKNGVDFSLPFSDEVKKILTRRLRYAAERDSPYVFPSIGHHGESTVLRIRHFQSVIAERIAGFVPNDLRRTFTTIVTNIEPPISHLQIKRLLNHKTVVADTSDVTAGYYATDVERLRPVVERISAEIMRLCRVETRQNSEG